MAAQPDEFRAFIAERLALAPVKGVPEICLHQARPSSALSRWTNGETPFWAFAWAGGLALARHVLDHPRIVANRRVLDFGAGSGLVAIAAAKAGASQVLAADIDPAAIAATELNALANNVAVDCLLRDVRADAPLSVDIILAGDVFYDCAVAKRVLPFLQSCAASGADVLIGDPNRAPLPLNRLRRIAHYETGDVGEALATPSYVYALR